MSLFTVVVGVKKDKDIKKFWETKIRPFLPDDCIKWDDVGFIEKYRIKRLFNDKTN